LVGIQANFFDYFIAISYFVIENNYILCNFLAGPLNGQEFLPSLLSFEKDNVSTETLKELQWYQRLHAENGGEVQ
jgi:hypothetical protein